MSAAGLITVLHGAPTPDELAVLTAVLLARSAAAAAVSPDDPPVRTAPWARVPAPRRPAAAGSAAVPRWR